MFHLPKVFFVDHHIRYFKNLFLNYKYNVFHVNVKNIYQTLSEESAALPLDEIWKNAAPGSVVDKKLRCQFEVPADEPVAEPAAPAAPAPDAAAPVAAAPAPVSAPVADQTFISSG